MSTNKNTKVANCNSGMALPKDNYKFIIGGIIVVLIGFFLMSGGGTENPNEFNGDELFSFRRITLAPFTVMIGYGVILYGILKKPKHDAADVASNNEASPSSAKKKEA